jgi:uncharacterized membrane protein
VDEVMSRGRLEAFSDGVFAIAITLLVLDIHVPESAFHDLWRGIADQWPSYLGYATSFITIGGLWMAHHATFRRLAFANTAVMRVNLVLLMAVAFLPFPTRLLGEAFNDTDAERAAVIFYGFWLLVIALLFRALWGAVVRDRSLIKPEVSHAEVEAIVQETTPGLGFYVAVIALAILAPKLAAVGYLLIAILAVLRAPSDPATAARSSGG